MNVTITERTKAIADMFSYNSKLRSLVPQERIKSYKDLYYALKRLQAEGNLPVSENNSYLSDNELAKDIYLRKYFLKDLEGSPIEQAPEEVFVRLASFMASVEEQEESRLDHAVRFYKDLYDGYYLPGGRVIAGAGDLYRLKTLANCFVTLIKEDNIESIYQAAYDAARTYSFGGGIGIDLSNLRPRDAVVHNAADKSTGAVSFMELYSLTTGLIGQSGRRGALMLTIDVKHPDVQHFIKVKKNPNWVTKQIIEQCKWTGHFTQEQLDDVERQVRENTQVRFANISLKVSDEFMQAVYEGRKYSSHKILVYKKFNKSIVMSAPQNDHLHYSYGIPSKSLKEYSLFREFNSLHDLNTFLSAYKVHVRKEELDAVEHRDIYGDYVVSLPEDNDLAIRYAGDFLLYFGSKNTGDIRRMVKAGSVWNDFVSGNYKTAEPGLIFWDTMVRYSPSNVMGRPIASTNPCGEVPLEDGGACNLASLNLSRFVKNGYDSNPELDWEKLEQAAKNLTRFLDNVISWNEVLNPLEKQKKAAKETRRLGIGVMGIADMFYQLGMKYDSQEAMQLLEKVTNSISNTVYQASSLLAAEKGTLEDWDYDTYAKGAYFKERLDLDTQKMIKQHGLRNIALLSIAPTGTISNVVLSYRKGKKNYIGISGGIEPVFSLFYTRRSESFGNKFFNVFHSTVQAYLDEKNLAEKAQSVKEIDDLRQFLPDFFFRTSHFIEPHKRVEIQGICQKYIDHSISSTVNLPESIDPETISSIYLDAWKHGLKGITIYRDGSRFPILSIAQQQSEFQSQKHRTFRVRLASGDVIAKGDEVIVLDDNTLSTAFHAKKKGIKVEEIGTTLHEFWHKPETKPDGDSPGAKCEVKLEGGKMIKSCSE